MKNFRRKQMSPWSQKRKSKGQRTSNHEPQTTNHQPPTNNEQPQTSTCEPTLVCLSRWCFGYLIMREEVRQNKPNTLVVNEIFHSIQGESSHTGRSCVFVRLTYCNLRCGYCDTEYAVHEGTEMSIDRIV